MLVLYTAVGWIDYFHHSLGDNKLAKIYFPRVYYAVHIYLLSLEYDLLIVVFFLFLYTHLLLSFLI